jgi:hypothetical protein
MPEIPQRNFQIIFKHIELIIDYELLINVESFRFFHSHTPHTPILPYFFLFRAKTIDRIRYRNLYCLETYCN